MADLILIQQPTVVTSFVENYENFLTNPCKLALQQVRKSGKLLIEYLNFILERSENFFLRFLEEIQHTIQRILGNLSLKRSSQNRKNYRELAFLKDSVLSKLDVIRSYMEEEDRTVACLLKEEQKRREIEGLGEKEINNALIVKKGEKSKEKHFFSQNPGIREALGIDEEFEENLDLQDWEYRQKAQLSKETQNSFKQNYVWQDGVGPVHKSDINIIKRTRKE